ncbi:MAG: Mrp/NBP35 family ATP-binding protein [Magnetococcales bacterium]|nr:Mrp/NBP35 family ATP-binding protein [Magnetococcales bacterium]
MEAKQRITAVFDQLLEPKLKWNINALNLLKEVELSEGIARVKVHLITDDRDQIRAFEKEARQALALVFDGEIDLEVSRAQVGVEGVDGVKKILFVGSGKGGVGKSTVAVNLATALGQMGFSVGLMDADIYGPSVPTMMGNSERPEVLPGEQLMPLTRHGIRFISAGSLIPPGKALDWRGQLVSGTLVQFIKQTCWGALDFLIVDLPPGTGDAQLTLASRLKTDGVILVATPQEVAWSDVRRAQDLFRKQEAPVLGLVENMAWQPCESCGHHNHPFVNAAKPLPEIAVLARLPLLREVSEGGDGGVPVVLGQPESAAATEFMMMARKVAEMTRAFQPRAA